ncbi:MAG: enoyl-CoA hydratase/isomerase family protein [Pseudomonadota bacterium]
METEPVLFEKLATGNDRRIGVITLNAEKRLHSLTLEMVESIRNMLARWIEDEDIACILITGAGNRAFCAGGDVIGLHRSATGTIGGPCVYAEAFFEHEYRMDLLFHACPKPVIAWGNGIVMGGGLGILSGCSHRVVTPKTRMAMPEVTIGLYPDVGGGWFFNRMPGQTGLFLALTGATFNAADALYVGIADYCLGDDQLPAMMEMLRVQAWADTAAENHGIVDRLLADLEADSRVSLPEGNIEPNRERIDSLCGGSDLMAVSDAIKALSSKDRWLASAGDNLMQGSPLSAVVSYRHLKQCRTLSLRQVFQTELVLSTHLVRYPEFAEGVRALLIDKDKAPQWQYRSIRKVPTALVDSFFQPPWPENPLSDLE